MSNNNLNEILSALHDVKDNTKLLKLLIEVRKKIDVDCPRHLDNVQHIRERGSFKYIIFALQTSKTGIINLALSILGNCCLNKKCARDLVTLYNILSNLNQLLKRFPKEDSIKGRAFRIVGNLCQHKEQWANVIVDKKPQIVIHIVKYLNDSVEVEDAKVSEATIIMGVRALRELLNKKTLEVLIEAYGVLNTIGMLLIKYGNIWKDTKKSEAVVMNIIKLLYEYSRYRHYPSILQMRNTPKGDSIACLSKILLLAPRPVVKIVMNFLKISHLKSDLPVPEIFDSFVDILRDDSIIQEFNATCEECIKCLCYLLDHPGNRENERCGECIPILINVLKNLTFETTRKIDCCLLIISSFIKCKYSRNLICDQIKCNIITILHDKLKLIVGTVESLSINHKGDRKRRSDLVAKFSRCSKRKRTDEVVSFYIISDQNYDEASSTSDEEIDHICSNTVRYDYSPASSSESEIAMSWTSGLSPQSSPRSQIFDIGETDSDDYSPVCSEVDPTDYSLPVLENDDFINPENESTPYDDIPQQNEELPSFDSDSSIIKQMKAKLIMEIVDLLKTYIKVKPPLTQLGTPELLLTVIKSSGYLDWPPMLEVIEVIYKILESHDYLLPLMKSDFIPSVYDLAKVQHGTWCSKCRQFQWISMSIIKKLSKVAESGGGKGDIAHKLLRGDISTKQQLVLVIPYIIRNRPILVKLMLNCGGLEVLMKLLTDESHLQNKSIKVLCILASKKLGIPNPKTVSNSYKNNLNSYEPSTPSTIVTFKLDDGNVLSADRELLSKNSDFFARLLNGDFKESNQDVITLPNVTSKSLNYLLELMKCDMNQTKLIDIDLDLSTHLDVIGLCDRFLMEEYRVYLTDCVEKFRLSSLTVPIIYNWSLESRTNLLRVECIAFALVANIIESDRIAMFKNLFGLGYTEELVEDIRKLLVRYMTVSQFCDCKKKRGKFCDKKNHCN